MSRGKKKKFLWVLPIDVRSSEVFSPPHFTTQAHRPTIEGTLQGATQSEGPLKRRTVPKNEGWFQDGSRLPKIVPMIYSLVLSWGSDFKDTLPRPLLDIGE